MLVLLISVECNNVYSVRNHVPKFRRFIETRQGVRYTHRHDCMSEMSPNNNFYLIGTVLGTIGWSIGGGWCGTLGYFFLERVGWRWFVLQTSVPLFIPSIVAFQFFLPESKPTHDGCNNVGADEVKTSKKPMILRIVKVTSFNIFRGIPYCGSILLLPAIFKEKNIKNNLGSFYNAMQGEQVLIITLTFGACYLLGKGIGYMAQAASPIPISVYGLLCHKHAVASTNADISQQNVNFDS